MCIFYIEALRYTINPQFQIKYYRPLFHYALPDVWTKHPLSFRQPHFSDQSCPLTVFFYFFLLKSIFYPLLLHFFTQGSKLTYRYLLVSQILSTVDFFYIHQTVLTDFYLVLISFYFLFLPPPKKELCVCLFFCLSDNWKSCERILTKFYGGVGHGSGTKWLNFGDDPAHRSDPGVRSPKSGFTGLSKKHIVDSDQSCIANLHCKNHSAILLCLRSVEVCAVWVLLVFSCLFVNFCVLTLCDRLNWLLVSFFSASYALYYRMIIVDV